MSAVIRHLNIAINGKPIVDDVDLDIADGERVGLVVTMVVVALNLFGDALRDALDPLTNPALREAA